MDFRILYTASLACRYQKLQQILLEAIGYPLYRRRHEGIVRSLLDHVGDREAAALMIDGVAGRFDLIAGDRLRRVRIYRARADRPVQKGRAVCSCPRPTARPFCVRSKGIAPGETVAGSGRPAMPSRERRLPVTDRVLFKSRYAIVTPDAPGLNISRSIRDEDERDRAAGSRA